MPIFHRSLQRSSSILFRLLGKQHSATLVMAGTLVFAGAGTVYLAHPASHAGVVGQGMLPASDRACTDQGFAWTAYTPATGYFFCPQNAPQP